MTIAAVVVAVGPRMRRRGRWPPYEVRRAIGHGLLVAVVAVIFLLLLIVAIGEM